MPAYSPGTPSGGLLEIGVALVLQDRFSQPAREANRSIRQLHNDAKAVVGANINMANRLTSMVGKGVDAAWGVAIDAIKQGASFINTMTTVRAITRSTGAEFDALVDKAQSLGYATMFESQDIASGMKYLAMAGNTAVEIQDMITSATNMAGATGLALGGKGGTADLLTNVMRTFKKEGQQAAEMIGDQMVEATISSNISMTDLAESIKYAAADMVSLKKELPEVAAMIGTLGNAGIQGSMAGTALGNMARYLTKSITDASYKGFKTLHGVLGLTNEDLLEANGDLKDFYTLLGNIQKAITAKGFSSTDALGIYGNIFGVRGKRAAVALSNDLEGFRKLWIQTMNASGTSAKIMEERMNSLPGAIDKIKSSAENLFTKFTIAIAPTLTKGLDLVASLVDKLGGIFKYPWISWTALVGVFLMKGVVGLTRISLMIKDIRNTGLVSFKSMFTILFSGWKGASLSATEYLRIVQAIKAQSMGLGVPTGLLGAGALKAKEKAYMNVLTTSMPAGYFAGKARGGGIGVYQSRAGGRPPIFVGRVFDSSGRIATNRAGTQLAKGAQWVESRIGTIPKPGMVPGMMSHPAGKGLFSGSILASIGHGLRSVGSGLMAMMGGPFGIAIMALSIAVPMIVSKVKANREAIAANNIALAKNTEAVNRMNGLYSKELSKYANMGHSFTADELATAFYNAAMAALNEFSFNPRVEVMLNGKVLGSNLVEVQADDNQSRGIKN